MMNMTTLKKPKIMFCCNPLRVGISCTCLGRVDSVLKNCYVKKFYIIKQ